MHGVVSTQATTTYLKLKLHHSHSYGFARSPCTLGVTPPGAAAGGGGAAPPRKHSGTQPRVQHQPPRQQQVELVCKAWEVRHTAQVLHFQRTNT
jgi:hypothetical protein